MYHQNFSQNVPASEHKEREYDLTTTDEEVDARGTTFGTH